MECPYCDSLNTHQVETVDSEGNVTVIWRHCIDCDRECEIIIPPAIGEDS